MKYKLFLLLFVLSLATVSAVPQVIFSEINLTITNGSYTLKGEGISATDDFPVNGNCTFNYERNNIPMTFSRNFDANDTDVAILIDALADNLNISDQWKSCVVERSNLNASLLSCQTDVGYESNYTECNSQLVSCQSISSERSRSTSEAEERADEMENQRNLAFLAAVVAIVVAFTFYRKANVQTKKSPFDELPGNVRM